MLAAPAMDFHMTARPHKTGRAALALSLVLHLLLAAAWLGFPVPEISPEAEEPALSVEIASEPPRQEPAKPSPQPASAAERQEERLMPIPQLQEGRLAAQSSPPKDKASPVPPQPSANGIGNAKKSAPPSQSERDLVLSQVLKHWRPPTELRAYEKADIRVTVIVDADGYFDDVYDARRPANPAGVFDNYNALPAQDVQRRTIDAFYHAIRKAQPIRLPPALKAKAPFPVALDFRFKDAR